MDIKPGYSSIPSRPVIQVKWIVTFPAQFETRISHLELWAELQNSPEYSWKRYAGHDSPVN